MTEVAVTVALFLIAQVGTAVWFASRINTTVDSLVKAVDELRAELNKVLDLKATVLALEARFEDLLRRVLKIEEG